MKKLILAFTLLGASVFLSSCVVTSSTVYPGYSSIGYTNAYVGYSPYRYYRGAYWGNRWNRNYFRSNYGWYGHRGFNRGWGARRW